MPLPADEADSLRHLLDRVAVDDLLTTRTSAIDGHDWDRLGDVLTPDASSRAPGDRSGGRA